MSFVSCGAEAMVFSCAVGMRMSWLGPGETHGAGDVLGAEAVKGVLLVSANGQQALVDVGAQDLDGKR
jgi:hypothetical protein